ncbi:hypothetical protein BH20VER1_BH20VER1_15970 [soil metagenome]
MRARRQPKPGRTQTIVAAAGLLLMAVSLVWWELRPRVERVADELRPEDNQVVCVVIDAGHGGQDSGAISAGVQEKDLTLDVARRVQQLAVAKGFVTVLTRAGDETVSLASRAEIANRERNCVFVSIHFDKGTRAAATGVQTFYAARQVPKRTAVASWLPFLQQVSSEPTNLESSSLASFVQEAMVTRTQAFDRGTRAQQFFVVANVRHPAVLVEGGFLSNPEDVARITTESYRQQLAVAISEGLVRYRQAVNERAAAADGAGPRS